MTAVAAGEPARARARLEAALALHRRAGDGAAGAAWALQVLGCLALWEGALRRLAAHLRGGAGGPAGAGRPAGGGLTAGWLGQLALHTAPWRPRSRCWRRACAAPPRRWATGGSAGGCGLEEFAHLLQAPGAPAVPRCNSSGPLAGIWRETGAGPLPADRAWREALEHGLRAALARGTRTRGGPGPG